MPNEYIVIYGHGLPRCFAHQENARYDWNVSQELKFQINDDKKQLWPTRDCLMA